MLPLQELVGDSAVADADADAGVSQDLVESSA